VEVKTTKITSAIINWLPAVMAACSLISLYAFTQIDAIVHQTLYSYGLQFSNDWAIPYWNIAGITVTMGWLIVILATLFQIYLVTRKPLVTAGGVMQPELKEEERWSTFKLGDGSTIKVKLVVKGAKRLNKYAPDGMPIYTVDTENIVRVVNVPEKLKSAAS
jgi:hypothetical protein